jgi:hypothetical protein
MSWWEQDEGLVTVKGKEEAAMQTSFARFADRGSLVLYCSNTTLTTELSFFCNGDPGMVPEVPEAPGLTEPQRS